MSYYIGQTTVADILGADNPRYFLALRRTDEGTLYFAKIDQLKDTGSITVNNPGLTQNDYEDFEYGVDFFDGRLQEDHSRPYKDLKYDQWRWDNKNCSYYIDSNGNFVVRINQEYAYSGDQLILE